MFGGDVPRATGQREKVLLRVFVHFYGDKVILLLGGYDKGKDPKERRQQRVLADTRDEHGGDTLGGDAVGAR